MTGMVFRGSYTETAREGSFLFFRISVITTSPAEARSSTHPVSPRRSTKPYKTKRIELMLLYSRPVRARVASARQKGNLCNLNRGRNELSPVFLIRRQFVTTPRINDAEDFSFVSYGSGHPHGNKHLEPGKSVVGRDHCQRAKREAGKMNGPGRGIYSR